MDKDARITLMDADRIQRSLNRMAHEIAEKNSNDRLVLLVGIDDRGFAVARTLRDLLASMFEEPVKVVQLRLKNGTDAASLQELVEEDIGEHFIITVDDVIFSGQTMFEALKCISEVLHPTEIHTAALVDRGHRCFPIKAEFCGMELPTKLNEHVSVTVEGGQVKNVTLFSAGR